MSRATWKVALVLLLGWVCTAHVRLRHPSNGNPLRWQSPSSISIVINSDGSDDVADGSHETALRNAIAAWNDVDDTTAFLMENTDPNQQARTDWGSNGIHLIWFDETNSSGYFPFGSGTVALTPIWFFSNGVISDADILFNGSGFQFTTSGQLGRFDIQDVGAHELGHLLGLDHSGWAGATMYPYVNTGMVLHRSLSADEVRGMHDMYPSGSLGRITGTVRRAGDSSVVIGAHVVAVDSLGRTAAGALTDGTGAFSLPGLPADTYTVSATPFEGPVSSLNLGAGYVVQADFESTTLGTVVVGAGATVPAGDILVGADVGVGLGTNSTVLPLRAVDGTTSFHVLTGKNLATGTALLCSDPTFTVTPVFWSANQVSFNLTVPPGARPGHVNLTAVAGGERSLLPAAVEVTPASPAVNNVTPGTTDQAGGQLVTITGTGFNPGARVVIGEHIYVDGEPGGCSVDSPTQITLTTLPATAGTHDVVVIDQTGVEGRRLAGMQITALPAISTLFPTAGTFTGGTSLYITGSDFVDGLFVTIDGVLQANVTVMSPELVHVVTNGGTPGGPYNLVLQNPGGGVANTLFSYSVAIDPSLTDVTPDSGSVAGGDTVTITGAGFSPTTTVTFGADLLTGAGGVDSPSVTFLGPTTLEAVVPSHGSGTATLLVTESTSGQAGGLASAFTFVGAPSGGGGGGGGGCHAGVGGGPSTWEQRLSPFAWLVIVTACVLAGRRRARSRASLA